MIAPTMPYVAVPTGCVKYLLGNQLYLSLLKILVNNKLKWIAKTEFLLHKIDKELSGDTPLGRTLFDSSQIS